MEGKDYRGDVNDVSGACGASAFVVTEHAAAVREVAAAVRIAAVGGVAAAFSAVAVESTAFILPVWLALVAAAVVARVVQPLSWFEKRWRSLPPRFAASLDERRSRERKRNVRISSSSLSSTPK